MGFKPTTTRPVFENGTFSLQTNGQTVGKIDISGFDPDAALRSWYDYRKPNPNIANLSYDEFISKEFAPGLSPSDALEQARGNVAMREVMARSAGYAPNSYGSGNHDTYTWFNAGSTLKGDSYKNSVWGQYNEAQGQLTNQIVRSNSARANQGFFKKAFPTVVKTGIAVLGSALGGQAIGLGTLSAGGAAAAGSGATGGAAAGSGSTAAGLLAAPSGLGASSGFTATQIGAGAGAIGSGSTAAGLLAAPSGLGASGITTSQIGSGSVLKAIQGSTAYKAAKTGYQAYSLGSKAAGILGGAGSVPSVGGAVNTSAPELEAAPKVPTVENSGDELSAARANELMRRSQQKGRRATMLSKKNTVNDNYGMAVKRLLGG